MPWKWLNILTQHFRSGGDIAADRGFRLASMLHTLKEDPASADPSAALAIVAQLHPSIDSHLHRSAIDAVERIIKSATPLDLLRLDAHARTREFYDFRYLISAEAIAVCANSLPCLGLIASHPDGHIREAMVGILADSSDGRELPFLLIRLNDWVGPVRNAARQAVLARIRPDYAAHLARNLPLVLQLACQSRTDHTPIVTAITRLLSQSQHSQVLIALLNSPDRSIARTAYQFLATLPDFPADSLIEHGLASRDTALRLRAARLANSRLRRESLAEFLPRIIVDPFMPLRREAIQIIATNFPDRAPAMLLEALFDPHPSIRELARFLLIRHPELRASTIPSANFTGYYRDQIHRTGDPRSLSILIAGLGETASAADAPLAESFLHHPAPCVRASSLRAYVRLSAEPSLDIFFSALTDDSARVASLARDWLLSKSSLLPPERLWFLFESASTPRIRRHALSLIAALPWWDSLALLLRAILREDLDPDRKSLELLFHWQANPNRFSAPLNLSQLSTIESLLHSAAPHLPQAVSEDLRKSLAWTRANLAR